MGQDPWQIAAARFCVERVEFTVQELEDFLEAPPYQIPRAVARRFFDESIQTPPGRNMSRAWRQGEKAGLWTAPTELVSMITDFDELREARKNARNAFWISMAALGVAALGAFFQYLSI